MTDHEAHEQAARYPHLDAAYFAYYAGRNSVGGGKNEFTDADLRANWARGRRDVIAEDRLSADTEWDADD